MEQQERTKGLFIDQMVDTFFVETSSDDPDSSEDEDSPDDDDLPM